MASAAPRIDVDVAVIGAGIAGLWLARRLQQRGLSVAICAPAPIGGEQTLASQGIIHSGLKYGLGGRGAGWAGGLAAMPARWRSCLAGTGELDLRGVPILADRVHLHAAAAAKPRALVAARLFASRCRRVDAAEFGPFAAGVLYETEEFAIDVPALVRHLAMPLRSRLIAECVAPDALLPAPEGIGGIVTAHGVLRASAYLLAAGVGAEALAERAGLGDIRLQRLPLRQTCVALQHDVSLFGHCLTRPAGTAPELTITSHGRVLYVGGRIAEEGAGRDADGHARAVRRALGTALPGIDLAGARIASTLVDRAEPATTGERTINAPFVARRGNCVLCLPVKLSLVPLLGDAVAEMLTDLEPRRSPWPGGPGAGFQLGTPPYRSSPC